MSVSQERKEGRAAYFKDKKRGKTSRNPYKVWLPEHSSWYKGYQEEKFKDTK